MRILHLTDTHLGAWRRMAHDAGVPPGWSRARDHQHALERALDQADVLNCDLVVHTGDVFDRSKPPWRWVQAAAAALVRAARQRPVVVLPGNHDRHGLSRSLPLHLADLHILDRPSNLELRGRGGQRVRLASVPYRRDAAGWVHGARQALRPGADLLLTHQAFDGVRVPGLTFRSGVQADTVGLQHLAEGQGRAGAPLAVLCGHIHPRQVVPCGDVSVVHPGCLVHTAFRDRQHPEGFAVFELGRAATWRFVDQPGRPLRVVQRPADLGRVEPGALVQLRPAADLPADVATELGRSVRVRGGWLAGGARGSPRRRPADRGRQLGLFG